MRPILMGFFYMAIAVLVWLVDGAILAFYADSGLYSAYIFAEVSAIRLLVRGLLSGLVLAAGFFRLRKEFMGQDTYGVWLGNERETLFCGSAESHLRAQRLLFHCLRLAKQFKLSAKEKHALRLLCYCYDIGLIGVKSSTIKKQGNFNPDEQADWDSHTQYGAEIAAAIPELAAAAPYILYHEEYYNGGGVYGLQGRKIPKACRIFQTVWMYDCMIYPPPGQRPLICDEALLELRYYSGTALDPGVVEAFIRMMGKNTLLAGSGGRVFSLR